MVLNQTIVTTIKSIDEYVVITNSNIIAPYFAFFYVAYLIVFLLIGLIITKGGSKNFWVIYITVSLFLLLLIIFIWLNPIQFYNLFIKFFNY